MGTSLLRPQAQAALSAIAESNSGTPKGLGSYANLTRPGESPDDEEQRRQALVAIYGESFPLTKDGPEEDDWASWAHALWERHRDGVADAIHEAERNRLVYFGSQWISSVGVRGKWREPPAPKHAIRITDNVFQPALDWRLQILTEQRPGFRFEPSPGNNGPDAKRQAEAKQVGCEYQWRVQKMKDIQAEAAFWAALDGVSFYLTWWNPDKGPWDELGGMQVPLGDMDTCVLRIEEVRVSANATATVKPHYWIVRKEVPQAEAVERHGPDILEAAERGQFDRDRASVLGAGTQTGRNPLYQSQATVPMYMVFCERSEYLPGGCTLIVVGRKVVFGPTKLVMGRVPLVRMADGSKDPRFFPKPISSSWVPVQQRINLLKSKWAESIRVNAGGRFLTKPDALVTETLVGGLLSAIEVRAAGDISQTIQPVQGFSVGNDLKELLQLEEKRFGDLSGWNDESRGQMSGDSGRAILASREMLERIFAPPVAAAATSAGEWAECAVGWMRWGYHLPRAIATTGESRPDLGRELVSQDFDGAADAVVDPQTMMPMPRHLLQFMLDDLFAKQIIDGRQYLRELPFPSFKGITSPDDVQEAKAKRVVEALRTGQMPEPLVWQDDAAIQQSVLERDLILAPGIPDDVRVLAQQRWAELAALSMQQQGALAPTMPVGGTAPPTGGGPTDAAQLPPESAPLGMNNPSVATPPAAQLAMQNDPEFAAAQFERTAPQ